MPGCARHGHGKQADLYSKPLSQISPIDPGGVAPPPAGGVEVAEAKDPPLILAEGSLPLILYGDRLDGIEDPAQHIYIKVKIMTAEARDRPGAKNVSIYN